METLAACQALDLRAIQFGIPSIEHSLSPATASVYRTVRAAVRFTDKDRPMYPDIDAVVTLLRDESLCASMGRWSWNPEPVAPPEDYV
jgi:histidine ammonia-lyase